MRKNAVTVTVATLVMGIFGAFLRWLQNMNIFDAETGLAARGSGISAVLALFSLAMLAVMAGTILFWLRPWEKPGKPEELLRVSGALPAALCWILAAVTAAAGVGLMFSAGVSEFPMAQRLLGAGAVVAGACLPFLPGRIAGGMSSLTKPASLFLPVFYVYWLIFAYRSNAEDPVLWSYAPEILAIAATTTAFYHLAGCFYGRPFWNRTAILAQAAAYLDILVLSDDRRTLFQALFAASAVMLLLTVYLMVANLREPGTGERERAEAEAAAAQKTASPHDAKQGTSGP